MRTLLELKSVEHLYALVGILEADKQHQKQEQVGKLLEEGYTVEQWDSAIQWWKLYQKVAKHIVNQEVLNSPLFRVTWCVIFHSEFISVWQQAGWPTLIEHAGSISFFSSGNQQQVNIIDAIELSSCVRFPRWRCATKGFEMEVFVYWRFSDLFLSLSLTAESLSMRQLKADRALGITALRPAIAYSLLKMANVKPGHTTT